MGHHHLRHDPLVPWMAPMHTRVLAVGGDTARLERLVTNLRLRRYQVTGSTTDPAMVMAGLRQGGPQALCFDLVMVDTWSRYPGSGGAARELFEFAVREPRLCAYAVPEEGKPIGPLEMKDLEISRKPIYNVVANGLKSLHDTPNDLYNNSPSTTASTIRNSPSSSSGRKARRNNRKHVPDTCSQEVEQDGEHVEKEQEQQAQNHKKTRVVWTAELHNKFLEVHDKLLAEGDAVPKKILKEMKVSTLSRENIASHLQKHRLNRDREARTDPPPTSDSGKNHHMSTPQAAFPPSSIPQQQAPPTMMQPHLSAKVYMNYGMNAHATLEAWTKSGMQDNRPVIHMQPFEATAKSNQSVHVDAPPEEMHPGADDPKQNSCVGNSDDSGLPEFLNKPLEHSWETEFLFPTSD